MKDDVCVLLYIETSSYQEMKLIDPKLIMLLSFVFVIVSHKFAH